MIQSDYAASAPLAVVQYLAQSPPMDHDREALFEQAEGAVTQLELKWPTISYLTSLRNQIAYLRAVQRGEEMDRTRLADINIGVIAAKDVEDRDPDVAAILHKLASVARIMMTEKLIVS